MKYLALAFYSFFLISISFAAQPQTHHNRIRLQITRKPDLIVGRIITEEGREVFKLTQSMEEAPFADIKLLQIDNDGLPEIETTAQCGQSCMHDIYKMMNNRYVKVFSGSYTSVLFIKNLYVFRGSSGCCSEDVRVYERLTSSKKKPDYSFSIQRNDEEDCQSHPKVLPSKINFLPDYLCKN
ncbi:MAG: hypothetical protein ACLGID_21115 [Gammaproteobacteria bacterium]